MKRGKWWSVVALAAVLAAVLAFAADESKKADNPEQAWIDLKKALIPAPQPAEWRTTPPTQEQIAALDRTNGILAGLAADKARDFYTKFPSHSNAPDARMFEWRLLQVAIELGETNRQKDLLVLREKRLADPSFPAEEKLMIRAQNIINELVEPSTNRVASIARAEKAIRELAVDFPKREEVNDLLLSLARAHLEIENLTKARAIIEEVARKASGDTKETAEIQLRRLDRIGKSVELSFTDLHGKKVDIKDYAGKVVLIDFWATWCGPCVAALPEVKETYTKFHGQGFEILGISLDQEKETLEKFVADEKMPWPQHFDGSGWENKIVSKFEITGLPSMWLVDKKGKLRDIAATAGLAEKVAKLMAEK